MKRLSRGVILSLLFCAVTPVWAAPRSVWTNEDKKGKAEVKTVYEGKQILRKEVDSNENGRPDKIYLYENGVRVRAELDRDDDGKIDGWIFYGPGDRTMRSATDTNKDGKPDSFKEFVNGSPKFVTREDDRNFDGKADRRSFQEFKPEKSITVPNNGRLQKIPTPGYVTIWEEKDDNFDGIIDSYYEPGKKEAKGHVGNLMNPPPTVKRAAVPRSKASS